MAGDPEPGAEADGDRPVRDASEVEAVSAELLQHYRAIPLVGALSGLRPSELLGLERRDVDRQAKVLHVRRVLIGGQLRPYGKTTGALRVVPLAERHWRRSTRIRQGLTRPCCSRRRTGLRSTCTGGGRDSGRRRFAPRVSPIAARMRCGTRSRHGRSPRACRRSRSRRRWARRWSSCRRRTRICCPTRPTEQGWRGGREAA